MSENKQALQMTLAARDTLRRIRQAAVSGAISPNEMQYHAKETMDAFAKALLQLKKPEMLKPEDAEVDHISHLNRYTNELFLEHEKLNTAGNPIGEDFVNMLITVFSRPTYPKKFDHENSGVVALLSTGALALAISSYLYDVSVFVAAVDKEKTRAVIADLDKEKVVVVDDVVGRQVNVVGQELKNRGHKVDSKTIMGI